MKGENLPEAGVPEAFKVLIKELQSLALDVRILDEDENEIDMSEDHAGFDETAKDLGVEVPQTEAQEDQGETDNTDDEDTTETGDVNDYFIIEETDESSREETDDTDRA